MKYRIQITEISKVQPSEGAPAYDQMLPVYDQTIEGLDVAKVVIAANEGHERTTTGETAAQR